MRIDPVRKCAHVNLVKKTNVEGEEEVRQTRLDVSASVSLTLNARPQYLFAPYSAFTVVSAAWNLGTSLDPHVIELEAAVGNKEEPEDLPLAPWS